MKRSLATLVALAAVAALAPAPASARERWETRVLARVGHPGFPAHAYVHPNGRIYEGTYVNGDSAEPSRILEYDGDGTLLRSWTMQGQVLTGEQGVQVATSDAEGRLVLLDHTPARAVLLDRQTGDQTTYAAFPPVAGNPAVPNYAAWGPGGELYVTDYANNVVWRVPPGGGTPELWLQHPMLATVEFGMTGIELAADRRTLLLTQQTAPAAGNPLTGGLFRVPIEPDGKPGALTRIWQSGPLDLADGFAIARSGRIYIAALGPNQIVVLDPDGTERERFPELPLLGDNGSGVPFDALSSVAFRNTSLITASQSNPQANPDHWAIHDVEVGEEGLAEQIPAPVATPPAAPIRLRVTPSRVRARTRARFRFTATAGSAPVSGARIAFAGRRARTDERGRATLTVRLIRPGRVIATTTKSGLRRGMASVTVLRPQRADPDRRRR